MCLPDTCSANFLNGLIKTVLGTFQLNDNVKVTVTEKMCQRNEDPVYWPMDIFAM